MSVQKLVYKLKRLISMEKGNDYYANLLKIQKDVQKNVLKNLGHEEIIIERKKEEESLTNYLRVIIGDSLNEAFKKVQYDKDRFYDLLYGTVHYNSHLFTTPKRIKIDLGNRDIFPIDDNEKKWVHLNNQNLYQNYHIINLLAEHTSLILKSTKSGVLTRKRKRFI